MGDDEKKEALITAIKVSKKVLRSCAIPSKDIKRYKDNIISMEKRLKSIS